jgi:hypothetical protein
MFSAQFKERIAIAYLEKHLTVEGAIILFEMTRPEIELMSARYAKYGMKGLMIKNTTRLK